MWSVRAIRLVKAILFLYALRKVAKVVAYLKELRRCHKMACKLPALPSSAQESTILGYITTDAFVGDKPLNADSIRDSAVKGFTKSALSDPIISKEGMMNFWMLNTNLCRSFPYHNMNVVMVFGESKLRKVFAQKNQKYFSKGPAYDVSSQLIGHSVLRTSGEEWLHQRQILDHGFKDDIMKASLPNISETVQRLVSKWEGFAARGEEINVLEEALKLTMDVLGRFAFGYDFGSVTAATSDDAPLYNSFNVVLRGLNTRILLPPLHYLRGVPFLNREFDAAIKKLNDVVTDVIEARRQGRSQRDILASKDLLDVMLTEVSANKTKLSDEQIRDNIKTLLFAGHDTTAANLSWLLYIMATQKHVAEKIRREYEAVLGTSQDANPTFEQLDELEYLNAVLVEGLRLYPSAGFTKKTLEDFELEGHVIPKGTELFLLPYVTHRNPEYYEDPESFKPERWMKNEIKEKVTVKSQFAIHGRTHPLFPFSFGSRNCVGRNLAVNELRIAVIKLLQRFDFEFVPNKDFQKDPTLTMTLNPKGIVLKCSKRA